MDTTNRHVPHPHIDLEAATLPELKREGVDLIQWWNTIEESRTEVLRRLAEVVVGIRARFFDDDGRPDWRGKTWDYRQFIGELYDAAGVPPDSAANIQAALRYHVGNLLREVVAPEDLAAAGLKETSPKERLLAARHEVQAIATALSEDLQSGDRRTRVARYIKLVDATAVLTGKLAHFTVSDIPKRQAQKALAEVEEAQAQLQVLADGLRRRVS